jgi:hypothetical protein
MNTPTPWTAVHVGEGGIPGDTEAVYDITAANGKCICTVAGADALLIVNSVNARSRGEEGK